MRLGISTSPGWNIPCTDTNYCQASPDPSHCDVKSSSELDCTCGAAPSCNPNSLPAGYDVPTCTPFTDDSNNEFLQCTLTETSTRQSHCAVVACASSSSAHPYFYPSQSSGDWYLNQLDAFLDDASTQPSTLYREARFNLADYARYTTQATNHSLYLHAAFYDSNADAVTIIRRDLALEARESIFDSKFCAPYSSANNTLVATTYFTPAFSASTPPFILFAPWNTPVPVAATLLDSSGATFISALIAHFDYWACRYRYSYPTDSDFDFGVEMTPVALDTQLSFVDALTGTLSEENHTIVLTVLQTTGAAASPVQAQYKAPGYIRASPKLATEATPTSSCFSIEGGATLSRNNQTLAATLTQRDETFANATFALNITWTSGLPSCAASSTRVLGCNVTAFDDLATHSKIANENTGFCNTADRVDIASCVPTTPSNPDYTCQSVTYSACSDVALLDPTLAPLAPLCTYTHPETGFTKSALLVPAAALALEGDLCQPDPQEALYDSPLDQIWQRNTRYDPQTGYLTNAANGTHCIHYFTG